APKIFAEAQFKVAKLKADRKLSTPFPNSIFTTTEISFCDVPNLSRKNWDATFYGLEVITSCGNYDWQERGGLISWDDDRVIPLPPGTTVVFPAGTKRFSFIPVAPDESRFLFRQFCHAGIFRWIEKGGWSDTQFEMFAASDEELEAWNKKRANRGARVAKMYSKIGDIYAF
ncbi:hypothetical protein B0H13DRAFT_1645009, partial [Mycena leptocephala]